MNYDVSFKLTNPEKDRCHVIKCKFRIYESGLFAYGNRKGMTIDFSESRELMSTDEHFDIRYDTRYDSRNEAGFIKQFITERWDGENGAWKSSDITVTEIIEPEV